MMLKKTSEEQKDKRQFIAIVNLEKQNEKLMKQIEQVSLKLKLERIHYSQKVEGSNLKNRRNILLLQPETKKEDETDESAEVESSF